MRVGFPGAQRLAWYDRNPYHRFQSYGYVGVAPHARTVRWTYTVPTGKKAFIEAAFVHLLRATTATTPGLVQTQVELTPAGGSVGYLICVEILTNTAGDKDHAEIGNGPILLVGDKIEGVTQDVSTAGTVNYTVDAKITEFNA